ncbi:MAG: hypothetical protein WC612_03385 [Bdellovibrionales bacterium]|jgi:hypothetical protein
MHKILTQKLERLHDLYTKWGIQTNKIKHLSSKAGELQTRSDLSPSLLDRLSHWVEQIAGLQEKEQDVISEITAIETKHMALRKNKKLRRAAPQDELNPEPTPRDEKKSALWFWMLLLWMMKSGNKKQPPTVH